VKDDAIGFACAASCSRKPGRSLRSAGLFDEFAATLDLQLCPAPGRILLHGHCHQKSLGLLPASVALLSLIPGAKIVRSGRGCCGMAGSFGYTRQHYDVSVAYRPSDGYLPAVRKMERGDTLIATGTSCRIRWPNSKARRPSIRPYLYVIF